MEVCQAKKLFHHVFVCQVASMFLFASADWPMPDASDEFENNIAENAGLADVAITDDGSRVALAYYYNGTIRVLSGPVTGDNIKPPSQWAVSTISVSNLLSLSVAASTEKLWVSYAWRESPSSTPPCYRDSYALCRINEYEYGTDGSGNPKVNLLSTLEPFGTGALNDWTSRVVGATIDSVSKGGAFAMAIHLAHKYRLLNNAGCTGEEDCCTGQFVNTIKWQHAICAYTENNSSQAASIDWALLSRKEDECDPIEEMKECSPLQSVVLRTGLSIDMTNPSEPAVSALVDNSWAHLYTDYDECRDKEECTEENGFEAIWFPNLMSNNNVQHPVNEKVGYTESNQWYNYWGSIIRDNNSGGFVRILGTKSILERNPSNGVWTKISLPFSYEYTPTADVLSYSNGTKYLVTSVNGGPAAEGVEVLTYCSNLISNIDNALSGTSLSWSSDYVMRADVAPWLWLPFVLGNSGSSAVDARMVLNLQDDTEEIYGVHMLKKSF